MGENIFTYTRDESKVTMYFLEVNFMPQPICVWRMAKSLDCFEIKSKNQGPWREFGACYRLLFPLGASSKSYIQVCNNPALMKSDYFVFWKRKHLGQRHRQNKFQRSKIDKARTWISLLLQMCYWHKELKENQAAVDNVISVSN